MNPAGPALAGRHRRWRFIFAQKPAPGLDRQGTGAPVPRPDPNGHVIGEESMASSLSSPPAEKPRLLDQVCEAIRTRHYSRRTEEAYVAWIRRFVLFHGKRHPREMGEAEIGAFLSALAVGSRVSASTQNQALCALLFLYREVLRTPLSRVEDVVRARVPRRLPVVLTREEVGRVPLSCMERRA